MGKVWVIAFILCFTGAMWGGSEADKWIERGKISELSDQPHEALEFYRAADTLRPNDPFILQKIARQLSDLTFVETDEEVSYGLVLEALGYAKRAYKLDSSRPDVVLSLAIIYGKLGLSASLSDKVKYARLTKRFAEESFELDPDYAWGHHVLGQWHCAVSELGSAKRFFASVVFGGLPEASLETGIFHLERAVELAPDGVAHRVELGFAYEMANRTADATEQWRVALGLPVQGLEDKPAKIRAQNALAIFDENGGFATAALRIRIFASIE